MINVELTFSINDAISLFRNIGLVVERREMPFKFKRNGTEYTEKLMYFVIINPYNSRPELLKEVFKKYIIQNKENLLLCDKLKVLQLFEK